MIKFAVLGLLAAIAVPASAQTPTQAPVAQPQYAKAANTPLDKVVCKTEDTLGTRLGAHRVCATEREWREQAQDSQDAVQKIQQGDAGLCSEGCLY